MTHLLASIQCKYALVYIDNIIFSKSFNDHLLHLEEVFKRLRDTTLKLKPSKCHFAGTELDFLEHMSCDGMRPNPKKLAAMQEFPVPKMVKQVLSFLGLSNYQRRFVKNYAKLASPLHKLTRKGEKFVWSDSCQVTFDKFKRALVSAPILAYQDFTKTCSQMLQTKASV